MLVPFLTKILLCDEEKEQIFLTSPIPPTRCAGFAGEMVVVRDDGLLVITSSRKPAELNRPKAAAAPGTSCRVVGSIWLEGVWNMIYYCGWCWLFLRAVAAKFLQFSFRTLKFSP